MIKKAIIKELAERIFALHLKIGLLYIERAYYPENTLTYEKINLSIAYCKLKKAILGEILGLNIWDYKK